MHFKMLLIMLDKVMFEHKMSKLVKKGQSCPNFKRIITGFDWDCAPKKWYSSLMMLSFKLQKW